MAACASESTIPAVVILCIILTISVSVMALLIRDIRSMLRNKKNTIKFSGLLEPFLGNEHNTGLSRQDRNEESSEDSRSIEKKPVQLQHRGSAMQPQRRGSFMPTKFDEAEMDVLKTVAFERRRSSFFMRDRQKHYAWEIPHRELKFEKKIGHGTFGVVYKGSWMSTSVAIKTIHSSLQNQRVMERFLQEIALMSTLHHPNIVLFLGAVIENPHFMMVMEYLPINLYELLHSGFMVDFLYLHRFACDIARGMKYLHRRQNMIQRDLKSKNVMIDNNFNAKICDFGLSRYVTTDQTMTFCGTPYWTAPEVIRQEPYTHKADVFSYGIILWELLTGREPYEGMQGMEVAYAVADDGLRPTIPSICPEGYPELLSNCWSDNPDVRPEFGEILDSLHKMRKVFDSVRTEEMAINRKASLTEMMVGKIDRFSSGKGIAAEPQDDESNRRSIKDSV